MWIRNGWTTYFEAVEFYVLTDVGLTAEVFLKFAEDAYNNFGLSVEHYW